MSADKPPYIPSPGLVTKVLDKIKEAATPQRFTQDFLNNKLGLTGGSANLLIPYLKKIGFLNADGSPTPIYSRYRNDTHSGAAIADAMRIGYKSLFEVNEKAQNLGDEALKGLIVQVTGQGKDDSVTKHIYACFKALKNKANFSDNGELIAVERKPDPDAPAREKAESLPAGLREDVRGVGMNLSYTINLNLPPTTDIAVFNAIFQSLRQNLLRDE
jgi:hypothetical protein